MSPLSQFKINILLYLFWACMISIVYLYFTGFRWEDYFVPFTLGFYQKLTIVSLLFLVRKHLFVPYFIVMMITGILFHDFQLVFALNILGVLASMIIVYITGYIASSPCIENSITYKNGDKLDMNIIRLAFLSSLIPRSRIDELTYEW